MTTRYKILLVDDEVEFSDTLRDVLEIQGYEISAATDGVTALDIMGQVNFDLVIMDIRMPRMDGMTLLKSQLEKHPELPVIIVTAYRLSGDEHRLVKERAKALFVKPLNMDIFLETVEKTLNIAGE